MKRIISPALAMLLVFAVFALPASAEGASGLADNYHSNNYGYAWSKPVRSYLVPLDDGTYLRVDGCGDHLYVLHHNANNDNLRDFSLEYKLSRFGGFYAGDGAFYVVTCDDNPEERDDKTILHVQKYDAAFRPAGECVIKGENTNSPVVYGSLRMTSTGGRLYIHTCHTMYKTSDGNNHQASMIFVIDEQTMTVVDGYSGLSNIGDGYVSHSFNQFIATDGEYVFRVDHGDAYPRGVAVTRFKAGESVTDVEYVVPLEFDGNIGNNYTGAEIGGIALSNDNLLIVGTVMSGSNESVFLIILKKDFTDTRVYHLVDTSTVPDYPLDLLNPMLVPLGNDEFLILFEEYAFGDPRSCTDTFVIDAEGYFVMDPAILYGCPLSDCQPVFCADGLVRWYVVKDGAATLYSCDPYAEPIDYVPGDVNGNGVIDPSDYAMAKRAFLGTYALTEDEFFRADIDLDGELEVQEYAMIKRHCLGTYVIPGAPVSF